MSFLGSAVGGALLGAGASIYGSKKQADASKKGAKLQMQQFDVLNRQQQPFIQSGYGALGKLNSLLGIGSPQRQPMASGPMGSGPKMDPRYMPTGNGGIDMRIPSPVGGGQDNSGLNVRLRQILALRARNGDTEAARISGML